MKTSAQETSERREETGEMRVCSACGTRFYLPLDGDHSRCCPGCDRPVQLIKDADRVRALLDVQRGDQVPAAPAPGDALDQLLEQAERGLRNS